MKITKPIIFFDLETTGVDVMTSRIVQIACIKIGVDGSRETKDLLVNPTISIPKEASDVHGITDEMVKDSPTFKQISKGVENFFLGCDIGGYNSDRFDIPLLSEEFSRAGINFDFSNCVFVDVLKLESLINTRKLGDVYKRYTGTELENSHNALADIEATVTILEHQLNILSQKEGSFTSPIELETFCSQDKKRFDVAGKMYQKDNVVYWSFGKNIDKPVLEDKSYLDWFLKSDFPLESKRKIKSL